MCTACAQVTLIDYNKHAHGRYRVCESEDSLEFSSFEPERWEIPLQEIKQVFHQGGRGGPPCGNERAVFEVTGAASQQFAPF